MSTDSVQHALRKYIKCAVASVPALRKKKVSPHTLRHATAMQMLKRGVDIEIIALKRKALKRTRFKSEIQPPVRPTSGRVE